MMPAVLLLLHLSQPVALAPPEDVGQLLAEADRQIQMGQRAPALLGARLLLRAHELGPDRLDTTAGVARAWFMRAYWSEKRAQVMSCTRRGLKWARRAAEKWPMEAEGFYWAAANYGLLAQATGILQAVNEGLATRIEKMGTAALKRNPELYDGAVQRLLGRYYQMLPWPLKKLDRAIELLEVAHRANPAHVAGNQYLGEALAEKGQKNRARALFQKCAEGGGPNPHAPKICAEQLRALQ